MFRLCNPFAVQNQIQPKAGKKYRQGSFTGEHSEGDLSRFEDDELNQDDDDDELHSHPLTDGIRQKPKLNRTNSAASNSTMVGNGFRISGKVKTLRAVEDEIFLLTLDLKWVNRRYSEYEEQLLVASYNGLSTTNMDGSTTLNHNHAFVTNNATYLCYECEQTLPNNIVQNNGTPSSSSSAFKSVLVMVIRCTMANKSFANNMNQQLQHLVSAMASLQYFVQNYQELPNGFDMTSPYNHNCLNSIEYAFMFADIIMAANLKYLIEVYNSTMNVSIGEKALQGFFIQNVNNSAIIHTVGGSEKESSSSNSASQASFIRHIQDLVNALHEIVSYAPDETTRTSTLIAYSHFLIKLCQVIAYCISLFEMRHQEILKNFHQYYDSLNELVTLVSTCIPCIQMIKQLLGHESIYYYILSIRYWHINEQLIWLMYFFVNKISSSSPHRAMFMLWKQKLFAGVYSILPTPQEFFFELQRMETRKQNVLGLSDDFLFDNMIQDLLSQHTKPIEESNRLLSMTKKAIVNSMLPPKASARKDDPGTTSTDGTHFSPPMHSKKGSGVEILNTTTKVDVMSFHARFILLGMIRMIQLHPSYSLSMSTNVANQYYSCPMTVPMKEKYFIALYEILFHLLDVTIEKKGLFKPYLLPIIAHLLMKLSIGMDRKPSTDWVFWKMAKEMARFNDYIKRRKIMQNAFFQTTNGPLLLGGMNAVMQSQPSYSARSHDTHNFGGRPPTHRTNNTANLTHRSSIIDLNLDTPFKEMKPSQSRIDSPSPVLSNRKHINISHDQPVVIYNNSNTANSSCAVSEIGDDCSHKDTPSNIYNIGDLVDGMCTLPNGTQRWYPGKITNIDMDHNTYTIQFDDGDVAEGKPVTELRPTKQRRKRSTSQKPSAPPSCRKEEDNKMPVTKMATSDGVSTLITPPNETTQHIGTNVNSEKEKRFEPISAAAPVTQSIETTKPSFIKQPLSTILSVGHFSSSELPTQEDEVLLGTKEITRVTSRDLYDIHSEDEGDEDRIFEIPSVFDTDRDQQMHKRHGDVIPKMQLMGLPMTSSLPQMAAMGSLSASLVCDDALSAVSSPAPLSFHKSVPSLKIGSAGQPSRYAMLANSNPHSYRSDVGDDGLSSGRGPSLNLGPKFLELSSHGTSDENPTGNTRLQSWRQTSLNHMGDDSSRFTGRTTGRSTMKPPSSSSNRLHDLKNTSRSDSNSTLNHASSHGPGNYNQGNCHPTKLVHGNCIDEDGVGHGISGDDEFSEENNMIVQYLLDTFGIITFILIKHCLLQSTELDFYCCKPNESLQNDIDFGSTMNITMHTGSGIASGRGGGGANGMETMVSESTNVLFILREYMELTTSISSKYSIASYSLFFEPGVYRLCKLLSPIFFDCCLKYHINSIELADKIGEGGFGSVYRVISPKSCNKLHVYSHCFSCYQKENCYFQFLTATSTMMPAAGPAHQNPAHQGSLSKSTCYCWKTTRCVEKFSTAITAATTASTMKMLFKSSPQSYFQKTGSSNSVVSLMNANQVPMGLSSTTNGTGNALVVDRAFAVKRIPRERSIHDSSVAFSLFQEISALEKMRNYIGVCGLEDYGVTGSEYWLVLESGQCNVSEWRKDFNTFKAIQKQREKEIQMNESSEGDLLDDKYCHDLDEEDQKDGDVDNGSNEHLEQQDVLLFMIIFLDILLILRDVHTNDIAHFDIKGSNFILRENDPLPLLSSMFLIQQQQRKPSGVLFLADFGESIVNISSLKDPSSVRQRARGTMCIQSPEMLCISEQTQNEMTTTMLNSLLLQQQQQVATSLYSEMTMGDLLKVGGSFSRNSFSFAHNTNNHSALNSQHNSNSSTQLQQQHANMMNLKTSNHHNGNNVKGSGNHGGNNVTTGGIKKKVFPLPDKSSDVWSLGCLLFELMTGNMLFADRTWPELYSKFCLDFMAGGPGSCVANTMMAMSALGEKLFGKFAEVDVDGPPQDANNKGISVSINDSNNANKGICPKPKMSQKKVCSMLLAMIEAGPLVEKMSRHISLDVQKSILRILCSCMQPDPVNRVQLMDLIDMTDEVIQLLMREHALTSPANSMALLAAAANPTVAGGGVGAGNSITMGSQGLGVSGGAMGGGGVVIDNGVGLGNSSSNIFDDLSFSLSVSLSGWTIDKSKTLNNNNRTHLSGTMSPNVNVTNSTTADHFLNYSEEDLKIFLPYSLMTKVTDCVYVTSRTMFSSILQQFLERRGGHTSNGQFKASSNMNTGQDVKHVDANEMNTNDQVQYPIRHLNSYLGEFLHPLDSNYKLFKSCYDLQSSVYTHMTSNAPSLHNNSYLGATGATSRSYSAAGSRENSIENISSSELFSDLINYLLHTNVVGSGAWDRSPANTTTSSSSELKSINTSSIINLDVSKHRKISSSSLFGGGKNAGNNSTVTGVAGNTVPAVNNKLQSVSQKYPATTLKNMKTPIVWIRLQTTKSSNPTGTATVGTTTESEDEKLSQACGIVVVTVPIPEVPSAPSPIMVSTAGSASGNNGIGAGTSSSGNPCKIDLKAITQVVLEVSNIIHHTIASRGAAPIVVVTVENHITAGNEESSGGALTVDPHAHPINSIPAETTLGTPQPTADLGVTSSGNKKPLVPILQTNNSSSGPTTVPPPPLSYIRSVSVNSFGLRSNEYGDTFSRLEVSFALAIAGFLSHAATKADVEPISMEDAVHLLVRIFRLMPWMEDLLDSEVLFTFLCYCFRQDMMKVF